MAKSMSSRSGVSIRFNLGGLAADQNLVWLFIGVVLIFVTMSILSPSVFLSSANLSSMAYQFPQAGLLALGIPVPVLIFAVSALAVSVVLNRTALGVKWYMLGTNVTAARFSGIKVETLQMQSYIVAGGLAALAGLLILAQTNSAKADYGVSYTLQSILIAVMGGVNPYGGFGKVTGVVLAIMILQFLSSGFNILGFNSFLKDFIWGASLLVVMMVNYLSHERQIKRASAASKN